MGRCVARFRPGGLIRSCVIIFSTGFQYRLFHDLKHAIRNAIAVSTAGNEETEERNEPRESSGRELSAQHSLR